MSNPFRSWKHYPWSALFQVAGLAVLIATALDVLLFFLLLYGSSAAAGSLTANPSLLLPVLNLLVFVLPLSAAFGVGALAIFLSSRFFRQIFLNAETIWALVGCLLLVLLIKSILPIPTMVVNFGYGSIVMVTVGAFVVGKRFW